MSKKFYSEQGFMRPHNHNWVVLAWSMLNYPTVMLGHHLDDSFPGI